MKLKIKWMYALIALGALATVSLLAQYAGPGRGAAHVMHQTPQQQAAALESLRGYLGLSDAQVAQLQDLSSQNRSASKATSDKIRSNQAALHEMLTSGAQPDEAKTGRLVLESTNLRTQLEASRQALV
jgi:Spy/CpxP family protein refolding chaperone